jgi:putative ABC transport system permease protein
MPELISEFRYAVRSLIRSRGVAVLAIVTLALGIGATTAVFTVVRGVLLRSLPYPASDRLVALVEVNRSGGHMRLADPNFHDFRDRTRSFSAIAKYAAGEMSVTGAGDATREIVARVSRDFFDVLQVQPSIGRAFTADDARVGTAPVIVVSHRYWTTSLGSALSLAPTAPAHSRPRLSSARRATRTDPAAVLRQE